MPLPNLSPTIDNTNFVVVGDNLVKKLEKISDRLENIGKTVTNKKSIKITGGSKQKNEEDDVGTFKDFSKGFARGLAGPLGSLFNPFDKKKEDTEKEKEKQEKERDKKPTVPSPDQNLLASTVAELSKGNSLQEKMLEELTVLRKITEGSLEFNKKSLKYTDPTTKRIVSRDVAKAREENIYIDDEGKVKVRKTDKPSPPISPMALEPSDVTQKEKDKAEDRELLADAIARKLADLLGGSQGGPSIEIDRDGKRRRPVPVPSDIPDAERRAPPSEPGKPVPEKPGGGGGGGKSKIPGRIGGALFGLDAILSAYEIGQIEKAKEEGKIDKKTANEQQAGIVGGLAGAGAGAAIGAGFGAAFGGIGAVPGAIIGGVIGGLAGKFGSEAVANAVQNSNVVESKDIKPAIVDNKGLDLTKQSVIREERIRTPGLQMPGLMPINNTNIVNNNNTELVPIKGTPRNNDPSVIRKLDQTNDFR